MKFIQKFMTFYSYQDNFHLQMNSIQDFTKSDLYLAFPTLQITNQSLFKDQIY